ncbi:nucleoside hydrolase [Novosphingobium sp. FSY-8]|uniref:Nucleoside hydrolase n=1 Tax=Novosphingobium ovatum TaxID=1908523 RepID=A0ABW9X936_9SPHN|nr:nucleoside hydrolase [Novosphingobium ovatum]NBC35046.1 nucleoside hydrolase [Novosphingobium ovatum]
MSFAIDRRQMIAALAASGAGALASPAMGAPYRMIPQRASARVVVDNDFAGDPDSLIALAHQLLTPKTRTTLITVSPTAPKLTPPEMQGRSSTMGAQIARELIRRAGVAANPPVIAGAEAVSADLAPTEAARAIVAEALREDPLPLFVTCGGPLTNVAAALKMAPQIARRMTVVWIGGGAYPAGGWEYNLNTDIAAAREVIERHKVPLWQIPQGAYRQMQASNADLAARLRPVSDFGAWLYDRFTTPPEWIDIGGTWPLGDSPTVLLTALTAESSVARDLPARRILPDGRYGAVVPGRKLRVFDTLDARLTFEDFHALMRLHAAGDL